ncbi:MAG: hypothetical protein K2K90_01585 [Lachnospiraceae bacterium]|nr:hypothetical protein [Lachnospiraceae bacterium]
MSRKEKYYGKLMTLRRKRNVGLFWKRSSKAGFWIDASALTAAQKEPAAKGALRSAASVKDIWSAHLSSTALKSCFCAIRSSGNEISGCKTF